MPEQVQDFYPTPSTISTCMYYTGLDPRTMEPVYVPTNPHEKAMQRALIQYRNPDNYDLVKEALIKAGREDLIGFDQKCLIKPRKMTKDMRRGIGMEKRQEVPGEAKDMRKKAALRTARRQKDSRSRGKQKAARSYQAGRKGWPDRPVGEDRRPKQGGRKK